MGRNHHGVLCLVVSALSVALLFGCRSRREANTEVALTGELSHSGGEDRLLGGAFAAGAQFADNQEALTLRGRAAFSVGSSNRLLLDAQMGLRSGEEENAFFARGGAFGGFESERGVGFRIFEVPTLWFGFQHHGRRIDPGIHFDVGPRVSLAMAGRAQSAGAEHRFKVAPTIGGAALVMGFGWSAEFTYMHIAEQGSLDVFRFSSCVAIGFAACIETRHVLAPFDGERQVTHYIGLRLGLGLATNRSWSPVWR